MNKSKTKKSFFDIVGIVISFLCIIHCIAFPFIMVFVPTYAMSYLQSGIPANDELIHRLLFYLVFISAGLAFIPGYRFHRNKWPLLFLFVGIAFIFFSAFFAHNLIGHEKERYVAISGSLCLVFAHFLNHRLCGHCKEHKHS